MERSVSPSLRREASPRPWRGDLQDALVCGHTQNQLVSDEASEGGNYSTQNNARTERGTDLDKASVKGDDRSGAWIYQLEFPSGKSYVGQTTHWLRRMRGHKSAKARDDGKIAKRAKNKYGPANVLVKAIERVTGGKDALNAAEVSWIARLGTLKPGGYNTTPGGDAQPMDDPEVAAWQKQRIGEAMRLPEVRAKKRALWKDPEHRAMQLAARNTDEVIAKRKGSFAAKRATRLASMSVHDGRVFMAAVRKTAIRNAAKKEKQKPELAGSLAAAAAAFIDAEIATYEAGLWRKLTQASSASSSNERSETRGEDRYDSMDEEESICAVHTEISPICSLGVAETAHTHNEIESIENTGTGVQAAATPALTCRRSPASATMTQGKITAWLRASS